MRRTRWTVLSTVAVAWLLSTVACAGIVGLDQLRIDTLDAGSSALGSSIGPSADGDGSVFPYDEAGGSSICGAAGDCSAGSCTLLADACAGVPAGWMGPAALWAGPAGATPPDCPRGEVPAIAAMNGGVAAGPATCVCTCAAEGQTCSMTTAILSHDPQMCGAPTCGVSPLTSGACANIGRAGGTPCGAVFGMSVPPPVPTGGSCMPTVTQTLPTLTSQTVARLCAGAGATTGPYATSPCVYQVGGSPPSACPAAYPDGPRIYYSTIDDTRGCSECTCGEPTGGLCAGTITVFSQPDCGGDTSGTAYALASACQQIDLPNGSPVSLLAAASLMAAGECAIAQAAVPTGGLATVGVVTVCCMGAGF